MLANFRERRYYPPRNTRVSGIACCLAVPQSCGSSCSASRFSEAARASVLPLRTEAQAPHPPCPVPPTR